MASAEIKCFADGSLDAAIAQGLVLVELGAPWCGPCRMQAPILEQVAAAAEGVVTVGKLDIDQSPGVALRFGVRSIPTLILFEDGRVVEQWAGVQQASVLLSAVDRQAARREPRSILSAKTRGPGPGALAGQSNPSSEQRSAT